MKFNHFIHVYLLVHVHIATRTLKCTPLKCQIVRFNFDIRLIHSNPPFYSLPLLLNSVKLRFLIQIVNRYIVNYMHLRCVSVRCSCNVPRG